MSLSFTEKYKQSPGKIQETILKKEKVNLDYGTLWMKFNSTKNNDKNHPKIFSKNTD